MSRIRDLLNALDSRALERHAHRVDELTQSNRALHREMRGLQDAVTRLAALTASVQIRTEQLMTLQREDATAGARLARFEPIFDASRIASHVRAAVAGAELVQLPFPHLIVSDLFPRDVYDALVDSIPPRILFEVRPVDSLQIRIPPRVAPIASIVMWQFLVEQIVAPVLVPALRDRFQLPAGGPPVSEGHIVLRQPGSPKQPSPNEGLDLLTTMVFLVRPGDQEDFGARLYAPDASAARCRLAKSVPFRSNSALTFLHAPGAHGTTIPLDAPAGTERYTLQFRISA